MRHVSHFLEFILSESKIFSDERSGGTRFSALLFGDRLVLIDNDGKSDQVGATSNKLNSLNLSPYNADVHLVVDTKKRTVTPPTYERTDLFDKSTDRRYRMKVADAPDPTLVAKLMSELEKRGIVTGKFRYIGQNAEDTQDGHHMYHGTTEDAWESIKRIGLRPMDTEQLRQEHEDRLRSMFRGNRSTILGYTDKNVYLTPSLDTAKAYAFRQAQHVRSSPVVLRVHIPDPDKLVIDDDRLLNILCKLIKDDREKLETELTRDSPDFDSVKLYAQTAGPIARELFSEFTLNNYPGVFKKTPWSENYIYSVGEYEHGLVQANLMSVLSGSGIVHRNVNLPYQNNRMSEYYQSEIPEYFGWLEDRIKEHYPKVARSEWKKSAYGREQAVAYMGPIMPKFIEQVPVEYKLKRY